MPLILLCLSRHVVSIPFGLCRCLGYVEVGDIAASQHVGEVRDVVNVGRTGELRDVMYVVDVG